MTFCLRLQQELARLQRNRERREARERQSGKRSIMDAASPDVMSPGSPMVTSTPVGKAATTRKCANCGQSGHIRKSLLYPEDGIGVVANCVV